MSDVDLSAYTFEAFVADHEAQLVQSKVPKPLYQRIWSKLTQQIFDAGSVFMFGQLEDEPEGSLGVYTAEGIKLAAESDVFLIDHAWTFPSTKIARKQLESSPQLLQRVGALMNLSDELSHAESVESIMSKLFQFGWLFEFVGKEGEDIASMTRLQNYYVLDELGSRFAQETDEEKANFAMEHLFFEPQQCAYSLCWPLTDVGEFERARHAKKIPILDPDSQEYWEARYQYEGAQGDFDWYCGFSKLQKLFCEPRQIDSMSICPETLAVCLPVLTSNSHVLMTGCGNAAFSADMYDAGYTDIVNMDYSAVCIEQMKQKYTDRPLMSWHEGDVTKLDQQWRENEFDLVLDKGCSDAILATDEENSESLQLALVSFIQQRHVLKDDPRAYFVLISHGRPQDRLPILETAGFVLQQYVPVETEKTYEENGLKRVVHSLAHVYICQKSKF